ncbi:Precorrin-8X methylmutase CbiC/CobH [Geobacter metallireducens RCH3]|uniref:Cobalt-precorrin-8X methylmutase n=1 Tax=Geobacter metallireducens (strain ATCC 53774 / DSM 7210 / GS-15) TaxID=269799 RepID=Q39YF4_GEOMG|nr:precorrin-8X methylmutase [Geobacter metallireducens]ABB30720.1 cobalt-precorrin-8X methylmutase [Geobacter metallireducens GS-15]EHP85527.1 Precorrin-8X methylmutase CbiC/CobH [Geobacter metallireducens RCH3]
MSVHLAPEEIEAESFRLIDEEVGTHHWGPAEWPVVRRAIHTSADFDYVRTMVFSPRAVARGVAALRQGRGIVTDTTMALSGIAKPRLKRFGLGAACFVADPEVAREAKALGITRSIVAMRKGAADGGNGIFVIGNAPTALFELLRLIREEGVRPALIVGLPVGFVGAAESKEALLALEDEFPDIPFITNRGRKGGSNVAAAVVNALLILAEEAG